MLSYHMKVNEIHVSQNMMTSPILEKKKPSLFGVDFGLSRNEYQWLVGISVACRNISGLSEYQWVVGISVGCRNISGLSEYQWLVGISVACRNSGCIISTHLEYSKFLNSNYLRYFYKYSLSTDLHRPSHLEYDHYEFNQAFTV